jgi:hypothetical protein
LIALVALVSSAGILTGARPAQAQFTEDFSLVSSANNWSNSSGTWSVDGGNYGSALNSGGPQGNFGFTTLQAAGFTNLTSFTFSFDLLNAADSGAVVRSNADGSDSLVAIFRPSSSDFYFIRRFNNGWQSVINPVSISSSLVGQDMRITLTANNGTYTASAARLATPQTIVATISATDANFATAPSGQGRVGLYQYMLASRASRYDNISVTGVAVVPEANSLALALPALGMVGGVILRNRRNKANKS